MVTIAEIFKYMIKKQSEEIHKLKMYGVIHETVEKYAYISPDGKQFRNKLPSESEIAAGWKWGKIKFVKLVGHISPKHHLWKTYKAAKHCASLLLTARLILKLNKDSVPEVKSVRDALKQGQLINHCNRGKARSLCFKAFRYLRKIDNRLAKTPERFESVKQWINQKQERISTVTIKESDPT
ncbi:MAG: hypothetical protein AB1489_05040 [Acidobacteriota bacterium]